MGILGIVCEYNPFHMGHEYHLKASKDKLEEDCPIICVMSGDFVQRGEAAMYSKFSRAEAACRCGADLVIELPLPWALSSAERFARGAVWLLSKLGATHISFGSECEDIGALKKLADVLSDKEILSEIKLVLSENANLSFAAARQIVTERHVGSISAHLEKPNNILAVEYMKAINILEADIEAINVKRIGSGHDAAGGNGPRSASELRKSIRAGESIAADVPEAALEVYQRENRLGRCASDGRTFEAAVISRLRLFDEAYFNSLPDAADGLGSRLYRAVRTEPTLSGIYEAAKTKRYAMSRIRRICMCAALGVSAEMNGGTPPYARVLAANTRGCELLRSINKNSDFPVITKPAYVKKLDSDCARVFATGVSAHDLYVLSYTADEEKKAGMDWRIGPKIV